MLIYTLLHKWQSLIADLDNLQHPFVSLLFNDPNRVLINHKLQNMTIVSAKAAVVFVYYIAISFISTDAWRIDLELIFQRVSNMNSQQLKASLVPHYPEGFTEFRVMKAEIVFRRYLIHRENAMINNETCLELLNFNWTLMGPGLW